MSKQKASVLTEGMVVGGQSSGAFPKFVKKLKPQRLKSRRSFMVLAVAVLVVGCLVTYFLLNRTSPAPYHDATGGDYAIMSDTELNAAAVHYTGHTVSELRTKTVNGRLLKSYDAAIAAAHIYPELGLPSKSMQAYAIANSKVPDTNFKFHLDYAGAAMNQQNFTLAKQQIAAARTALAKNSDLSSTDRAAANKSINTVESYLSGDAIS